MSSLAYVFAYKEDICIYITSARILRKQFELCGSCTLGNLFCLFPCIFYSPFFVEASFDYTGPADVCSQLWIM